jgi:hypothetical protein
VSLAAPLACSRRVIVLTAPFIGAEIAAFIENFPTYIQRLHEFTTDPARPWLRRIVGEGFGLAQQSSSELAHLAAGWLTDFLHSLWSGGRALISILSLLVVTRSSLSIWSMTGTASLPPSTIRSRRNIVTLREPLHARSTRRSAASCGAKARFVSSSPLAMRLR